ncbi:hypothetical protein MYX04_09170 [Nitrospiraceae bacterium AH_259_D15_M11_P09]|nr:hypothetical protein [Nitrospiraceae bacterium AH_259_D15_M11_P09]
MKACRFPTVQGTLPCIWRVLVALLFLITGADRHGLRAEDCHVSAMQGGVTFPVSRLSASSRCKISEVVNGYTTVGVIGPVQAPIAKRLYTHLLDRPVIMASLVRQLGLGAYQVSEQGHNRYWVDDGEGTRGLLSVVYRDETSRIYHMDGHHEGRIFPLVRAKAVVFMRIRPTLTTQDGAAVESLMVAYTRLNDPVLAALVRVLRPLIGDAVTGILVKGFRVTDQLASRIAQDPDGIAQRAASLSALDPEDLSTLTALLRDTSRHSAAAQPFRPTP